MSWGSGWGTGGRDSGSGWGATPGLPSSERNEAVARDLGGGDSRIQRSDFEAVLHDELGMDRHEQVTEEQVTGMLVNLGFEDDLARDIVDGMVEEFPDGFTGDEFLDEIFVFDTDDNGLEADELGEHHEEIAELADRGWGSA